MKKARSSVGMSAEVTWMRLFVAVMVGVMGVGAMQGAAQDKTGATVPVVMLSDIHLDPFHDPAKVAKLRAANVEQWEAILSAADSATKDLDWAALQKSCKSKGIDTPIGLLTASVKAERETMPQPLFVTVSGDLMAHQFDCKFKTLAPLASEADYSAFAAKTVAFVALEVHKTFPDAPVYFALGNNDSGCKDYEEDAGSAYLKADGATFAASVLGGKNATAIEKEFSQYGDYNVLLPSPLKHTRLIVLQDIFESKKFAKCSGAPDETSAKAQIEWLRKELGAAKAAGDKVWVMAHIPPGIDPYTTLAKGGVCDGSEPSMFLGSTGLADALKEYAGTVKLALFGHTHMDEMKLLRSANGAAVPVKLVPSITPVNGNNPAFTVAQIDARTAMLLDYTVYASNDALGSAWAKEYTYSGTYGQPDFSADSVGKLIVSFVGDQTGALDTSRAYQNFYFVGDPNISKNLKAAAMQLVWHGYACAMTEMDADAFRSCTCGEIRKK